MTDLKISKTYKVKLPRDQLFKAWVSPDTIIPPVCKIEVVPKTGGYLKLIVETPQGISQMFGVFQSIHFPDQLLYSWEWNNDGEVTQVAVKFIEENDITRVEITHSGFQHEESRETHDAGWDAYIAGVEQMLNRR